MTLLSTGVVTIGDVTQGVTIALGVTIGLAIFTSFLFPRGTIGWKHQYATFIYLAAIVAQLYFLALAAVKLPLGTYVIFSDCRNSYKGGKQSGSFRDCEDMQGPLCTKEQPCTACDVPLQLSFFDNSYWTNDCYFCETNPILDQCSASQNAWCVDADGGISKCNACCLVFELDGVRQTNSNSLSQNNCSAVFQNIDWLDTGVVACQDPLFPTATRYGCCPPMTVNNSLIHLGSGTSVPACLLNGPNQSGWFFCEDQYNVTEINGVNVSMPSGCPYYVNGVATGESYCQIPTAV